MNAFEIVNWLEVFFWPTLGIGVLLKAIAQRPKADPFLWILAPTLVLFGISDYIELQTGAWWKPLGLLFLKIGCISVFLIAAVRFSRRAKKKKACPGNDAEGGIEPADHPHK